MLLFYLYSFDYGDLIVQLIIIHLQVKWYLYFPRQSKTNYFSSLKMMSSLYYALPRVCFHFLLCFMEDHKM